MMSGDLCTTGDIIIGHGRAVVKEIITPACVTASSSSSAHPPSAAGTSLEKQKWYRLNNLAFLINLYAVCTCTCVYLNSQQVNFWGEKCKTISTTSLKD